MDAPARRAVAATVFLLIVGVVSSIWRGDTPAMTLGLAVAGAVGGGFLIGCYLWARRKD